jgi:hypothetical protein
MKNLMKNTINITKLEAEAIQAIAINEYNICNGSIPDTAEDTQTFVFSLSEEERIDVNRNWIPCPLNKRNISGVISSLVKKELVWEDIGAGEGLVAEGLNENAIALTEKGFEVFKTLL